jgi:hypothetical protein
MDVQIVSVIVEAATTLLGSLGTVFSTVIELLFDFENELITDLGVILLITAGFSLAYAGIRFVFGLVSRLTGATRGGAR